MTTTASPADLAYTDQPTVLVIAAEGRDAAAGAAAVHADLRVVGVVPFEGAADALASRAGPDLIAIETAGADPDSVAAALPAIDTLARDREIDVVVAFAHGEIDLVAGPLLRRGATLLCDPGVAERVAAYSLSGGVRDVRLHDQARDADARIDRLNAEVARFADTLAKLAAEGDRPRFGGQVRDSATRFRDEGAEVVAPADPAAVRDAIRARRMRAAYFPEDLFADPAWDMLLDLYAAELEHRRVSVSSLCIAAAVPGTTALRWIGSMVEAGLFERDADMHDRRRAFISLSARSRTAMQRYFDAIRRARLSPA